MPDNIIKGKDIEDLIKGEISKPLVSHIYTADPSAHVFNDKIYIYPSHDIDAGIPFNDNGAHFGMEDYHVISMDSIDSEAIDNGVALHVDNVPWAERQMWAPDAAQKNGKYYLYFPARAYDGIFRIGVAVSDTPIGPFIAQPEAIKGSYSIDPAVFEDDDGRYYMYFGGIWGGQLQKYRYNKYDSLNELPGKNETALGPIVAKMTDDLLQFAETPKEIRILDKNGSPLLESDNDRRFFEAAWMHKHNGRYYLSYSTGETHFICYATGNNPYGPFTYQGRILEPVIGWTTHHSICKIEDKWYLFYHDSSLSNGVTHLRSVKVAEITYRPDGSIESLEPYNKK
ncbi:MAG TPA: glycoside hydrolase family 43 protein [Chitinophagales bacterium]|nr:glycoside hydrolase family 43 protein [Chitinophagales bacterium]